MDIWPELHLTCAKFRLEVEHPRKFGWFPEAVLRGALGYFWHAEGKRFERLYELFFGAADKAKLQGIATPPIGAVLNCSPCGGSFFELEVILFGKHEEQVPLLLESLHILGREGVGESYERFFVEGFPRYGVGELREWVLNEPIDGSMLPESFLPPDDVSLELEKPMTLRAYGGKFLFQWDTDSFFNNLVQRLRQLAQFYGTPLPADWGESLLCDARQVSASSSTRVVRRGRTSSRQQAKLDYSGFKGSVVLQNVSADLFTLLRMGAWVGVGKNTVMGSGRYFLFLG